MNLVKNREDSKVQSEKVIEKQKSNVLFERLLHTTATHPVLWHHYRFCCNIVRRIAYEAVLCNTGADCALRFWLTEPWESPDSHL